MSCLSCGSFISFESLDGINDAGVRSEVGKRLARVMGQRHSANCPWRVKSCPGKSHPLCQRLRLPNSIERDPSMIPLDGALADTMIGLFEHD